MASIGTGEAGSDKRALNHQLPLVPFIDLLLCCVMFLLVTAVWNDLAQLTANTSTRGRSLDVPAVQTKERLTLLVQNDGFTLVDGLGAEQHLPRVQDAYDREGLAKALGVRKRLSPEARSVTVVAEDGVVFADLTAVMDVTTGAGFDLLTLSDSPR